MTTPAGWYDDGSGRLRWWDGVQWTEHFAPQVDAQGAVPEAADAAPADAAPADAEPADAAADAAIADALGSVSAVEAGRTWTSPETLPDQAADTAQHQTADEAFPTSATTADESPIPSDPGSAGRDSAPTGADEATRSVDAVDGSDPAPSGASPSPGEPAGASNTQPDGYGAPVDEPPYASAGPTSPTPASPYATHPGATPAYPAAPPYAAPSHGYAGASAAPGYPGASAAPAHPGASPAPAYPGSAATQTAAGYPVYGGPGSPQSEGRSRPSVVGLVGFGLAALGTVMAFIPFVGLFSWILLGAGFVVSLISLFLRGRKWPGIVGMIVSVVGFIVAVVIAFVVLAIGLVDASSLPDEPQPTTGTDDGTYGSDDDGTSPADVVEATMGEPVTVTQFEGSAEVTITSAMWTTDDGSGVPTTNGGYVVIDATWTGIDGTSSISPLFVAIEAEDGSEGDYDYYVDGLLSEQVTAGQTVSGTLTFDVAQSPSYTVVLLDDLLQEVARVSVTPTAG